MKCHICQKEKPTVEITCPECQGSGGVPEGIHYRYWEGADGNPEVVGEEIEFGPCRLCETKTNLFVCGDCGSQLLGQSER